MEEIAVTIAYGLIVAVVAALVAQPVTMTLQGVVKKRWGKSRPVVMLGVAVGVGVAVAVWVGVSWWGWPWHACAPIGLVGGLNRRWLSKAGRARIEGEVATRGAE